MTKRTTKIGWIGGSKHDERADDWRERGWRAVKIDTPDDGMSFTIPWALDEFPGTNNVRSGNGVSILMWGYRTSRVQPRFQPLGEKSAEFGGFLGVPVKLPKAYSSNKNWSLAPLSLDGYRCDGVSHGPFIGQWFVINAEGHISFLGQGMWLVDAGDYDNDGKSELVFAIGGYDI